MVFLIHIYKLYNTAIHADRKSKLVWALLLFGVLCIVGGYRKRDNVEKIGWYILGISIFTSGIATWTSTKITLLLRSLCLLLDILAASYFLKYVNHRIQKGEENGKKM